ncbi:MAG: HAD hydrolase-like protein [Paracoccaceae bacterium]
MFNPKEYDVIFFDFDGVVKESVSVKTDAYAEIFSPYGSDLCEQIKSHHLANGGMSRYEKIPLYLEWAGLEPKQATVKDFCSKFSSIVKDRVITSAWVPGVENFLKSNKDNFIFVLVSATPQDELEDICKALNLTDVFRKIFGAPNSKSDSIRRSLVDYKASPSSCLMIGDAEVDWQAARANEVHFILRKHQDSVATSVMKSANSITNFLS